jgi:3D-(3,5/4)-trihydroxycyclohexane-1,2-dione acylhydrolase (decyclizing)
VIIAGGGVHYSQAWKELEQFSERFGIPVGETFAGRGAVRKDTDLLLRGHGVTGTPAAAAVVSQADLVICIGTRLTDFSTGSQSAFHRDAQFISINVCGHDAYKQGALPLVADARETLKALLRTGKKVGIKPKSRYLQSVKKAKQSWEKRLRREVYVTRKNEAMSQGCLIGILNEEAHPGDTIIAAAGAPPGDLHQLWNVHGGKNVHLEFGYSCMGYEIPAGLGVRMAQPKGEVYVLIGDGTYLMNPTELVTAMQENLKITVVISENHGFQVIRQLQMARVGTSFGNEFRSRDQRKNWLEGDYLDIDFAKNAESLGARSWFVRQPEELRKALQEARDERRSCVIVVETEKHRYLPWSEVWWDVAPAEVASDEKTLERRVEYEENRRKLQKFHY